MKQLSRLLRPAWAAVLFSLTLPVLAQETTSKPTPRLTGAIVGGPQAVLTGSQPLRVKTATDLGAVANDQPLKGITLVFNRSSAQETDLQGLLAAQQNPASPLYHQWLTPDQFAARFGVADSDISAVENWLQTQGFSIDSVGRSRNRINFSGNAGQVSQAFGAPLHHYKVQGVTHTAPAADLSVPAALASMVSGVLHLSDLRPHPELQRLHPSYTSSKTEAHYLTPVDLATMYDVSSVYSAGFNGAGQSVAIVGQSAVDPTDISRFQAAEGFSANLPTQVLVPGTGVSSFEGDRDEAESDIDLEYASGMAQGAHFFFVYTGDDQYYGALDALQYAVEENIAPVISASYGDCEIDVGASYSNMYNTLVGEQANAQGQTIFAASGDEGSTGCAPDTGSNLNAVQLESLSAEFPAALPTVTGMGGTQMVTGASTAGTSTYWTSASGSDVAGSLRSYVPEVVWNEDNATYGLSSGGGGVSTIFGRPTWQTGVPGITTGNYRLVPDLALQASGGNPGYLICSSDSSVLQEYAITSSCNSGFRDSTTGELEAGYGGTSFAAPVMAGLLAVLNQATHSTGQGNINPTLYALASNTAT
ncbi:MAG: S53 family peptidase, partial [Janthinobacterium lividum]